MTATFEVEDGQGWSDTNAYLEVEDADQIIENYGNSSDWSAATEEQKQNAIREATRYLDLHYYWDGYKVYEDQALKWPRYEMYDEDGNAIDEETIPEVLKQACAYLALKVIEGDTLLEDFDNESKVKKTKDVVGPLTEEREYVHGESPDKTYQIADKLVYPFILDNEYFSTDIERA